MSNSKQIQKPTVYVVDAPKSHKIINGTIACMCGGVIATVVGLTATYDSRVSTNQNKVQNGAILSDKEAGAELNKIEGSLSTLYTSAENTFAKQKAKMYAQRDVQGLNNFYNSSYQKQQQFLDAENCNHNPNLKECEQFKKPLPLMNVSRGTHRLMPKNPFTFNHNKPAPPVAKVITKPKPKEIIEPKNDPITHVVAENNIRNIINK